MSVNNRALVTRFVVDMPDSTVLGFDPFGVGFSWRDVIPQNYMNLDWLEEKARLLGGYPVYTPVRIVLKPVVDPEDREPDLSPKLVMEFEESVPSLVLNRTRCTLITKIAGTANPVLWIDRLAGGRLEIYAGADRDFSASLQILFRPVRGERRPVRDEQPPVVDAVNDELFG